MKKSTPLQSRARAAALKEAQALPCAWSLVGQEFVPIKPEDFRPPSWMAGTMESSWQEGGMHPQIAYMLPIVAKVVRNIAPTRQFILLPSFQAFGSNHSLGAWSSPAGICSGKSQGMLVAYHDMEPWRFLDVCLHEAWHAIEPDLEANDGLLVRGFVHSGLPMPSDYYREKAERTARAFAAYALYRLSEDGSLRPKRSALDELDRTATDVFEEVLTGSYSPLRRPQYESNLVGIARSFAVDARDIFAWLARAADRLSGVTPNGKNARRIAS